ncbi:hypothetical protein PIB30_078077 [Stylosanthes scabra]|uniref:Uncharacterized protein n=1 Tax=Stylosanthes scabra TaxID=79078 RepID=A0ABU6XSV1_9FABA|nr:hypothetical protein [Stylosanthes scabra]
MHAKDGWGSDQWWPQKYQRWHGLWASRFAQLFEVAQTEDPGPSVDFLRWWFLAGKRRPAMRMMVGTRTTTRDWHWLDEMMADDVQAAPPTQRIKRMAEGRGRSRGGEAVDGSQVHLDLNEPVSGPSQTFMLISGTPPLAHVLGASWEIPFMAPASVPTPPASPALAEQPDEPAAHGQARRVPRR